MESKLKDPDRVINVLRASRVFWMEERANDWTHAAMLVPGLQTCTVLTEGPPRVLVVPTIDLMACHPYWCGGCPKRLPDGRELPTEFFAWQQERLLAGANLRLANPPENWCVKTVPPLVGQFGIIHPQLDNCGDWKTQPTPEGYYLATSLKIKSLWKEKGWGYEGE